MTHYLQGYLALFQYSEMDDWNHDKKYKSNYIKIIKWAVLNVDKLATEIK